MTDNASESTIPLELYHLARSYCHYTEQIERVSAEEAYDHYRKLLPLLYTRGSMIPETDPVTDTPERYVTEQQWETVYHDLQAVFGEADVFYFIDYADPSDTEPWKGSLADHLADIYQDLKDFVLYFEKGTHSAQQNAVFQCRQLFQTHWGERLTRALCLLHSLHFRSPDSYEDL
ncbi:MAG TPA: DUF5063 domain-containing protein [Bacteroidales bacterium]|jgi:hypothetical protein|nr:DUF5063 domain-containing protein [Lentimicrobiaceae bacterium]HOI00882.1 DUF5063 domain-containing protein [Bacteroidales bacterium]